jgi:two-component system response regulator AtoC
MPDKKTILLVDDDPKILDTLALTLQATYEVLTAVDGVVAAHVYERHLESIEALVTDLEMPRLSGSSLAEWVHHIRPHLPVIIISGRLEKAVAANLPRGPMISFLGKPFEPNQLEAALQGALEQRESV